MLKQGITWVAKHQTKAVCTAHTKRQKFPIPLYFRVYEIQWLSDGSGLIVERVELKYVKRRLIVYLIKVNKALGY